MQLNESSQAIARDAAASEGEFLTYSPADGSVARRYVSASYGEVDAAVSSAAQAQRGWALLGPTQRAQALARWGAMLTAHQDELAALETSENGKLIKDSRRQMGWLPDWLAYYGGLADKIEGRVIPHTRPDLFNYTLREPIGVIGVITPWNSPASLTMASAAPALVSGNAVVVKPSEVAPAVVLRMAELALEAGLPENLFAIVVGGADVAGMLIDHPGTAKISFTGGVETGKIVAARAGGRLASCTLELGGKSANIVFPDADLDRAARGVAAGIFSAAGQTCVAGSRVYVHNDIKAEFLERLTAHARAVRIGQPLDETATMGPIATASHLERIDGMVRAAVAQDAVCVFGGERLSLPDFKEGYYFQPTILLHHDDTADIVRTEVFGPVISVMTFDDEDEVVSRANGTKYGLAAGVWTRDLARAHRVAARMVAGTVWVNMYRTFAVQSPMSGRKDSGFGIQNGQEAIHQYLSTKSICCDLAVDVVDRALKPASTFFRHALSKSERRGSR